MKRRITTDEELAAIVVSSKSIYDVLRAVGCKIAGGSHSHYSARIKKLGLDTTHFLGQASNKGKVSQHRKTHEDILVLRTEGSRAKAHQLVRALLDAGVEHVCAKCRQPPEWLGNPLTLDVDHINENWLDDRLENLRFLCPNCHSQFSRRLMGM